MQKIATRNEIIILIHGLMRTDRSMRRLGYYLSLQGYEICTYSYPSTQYTIAEHSQQLRNFIENLLLRNPGKKLHFVGHSLGGIIAREALSQLSSEQLKNCINLVMLAPPNQGSPVAKIWLALIPAISRYIKPLPELSSAAGAYIHQVAIPQQVNIGVIAARFDAKAPARSACLQGQADFIILNCSHTFIMAHPQVKRCVINFLQRGRFLP